MKNWFFALLRVVQAFFKKKHTVNFPLWAYCAILVGLYLAGYLVGKF